MGIRQHAGNVICFSGPDIVQISAGADIDACGCTFTVLNSFTIGRQTSKRSAVMHSDGHKGRKQDTQATTVSFVQHCSMCRAYLLVVVFPLLARGSQHKDIHQ